MPIFKIQSLLVFFAHIPKCAGTSVERYIKDRYGNVALLDRGYMAIEPNARWSQTSPQHLTVEALERLFPPSFFDAKFTVVRHPEQRLASAFHFQRDVRRVIPPDTTLSEWIQALTRMSDTCHRLYDNHSRPMVSLVPDGTTVFHLEQGLDQIVNWLDGIEGGQSGPRHFARLNEKRRRDGHRPGLTMNDGDIEKVYNLFRLDYERFGYLPGIEDPIRSTHWSLGPSEPNPSRASSRTVEAILTSTGNPRAISAKIARIGRLQLKVDRRR